MLEQNETIKVDLVAEIKMDIEGTKGDTKSMYYSSKGSKFYHILISMSDNEDEGFNFDYEKYIAYVRENLIRKYDGSINNGKK